MITARKTTARQCIYILKKTQYTTTNTKSFKNNEARKSNKKTAAQANYMKKGVNKNFPLLL
jgi:hypothetical protein